MEFGNFTVAMVKTLYKRSKESLNIAKELKKYELLIVDESHRASGDEYSKLLQKVDAGARIFVSGTPLENEDKVKNMVIIGLSGRVLGKVTNQEMIDKGVSQRPIVKFLFNNTPIARELDYDAEEKEVIQRSITQAENILNLCIERKDKKGVVSFIDIEHGEFLQKWLNDSGKLGVVELVHGKDRNRAKKIDAFKEGKIDVLISSMILKEGLNIPNIHYLIRAEGGKSVITSKQFVGRAIRDDKENTTVEIIDFYHGSNSKYCSEHSMKRLKTYKKEGFEIILDPALKGIVKIKLP
jgi:superfamily II DNA or RNA helicase